MNKKADDHANHFYQHPSVSYVLIIKTWKRISNNQEDGFFSSSGLNAFSSYGGGLWTKKYRLALPVGQ
ncbi:hypothetical protein [Bacillus infantis]|uniref:Uncharacterized protein n=1 Tax=Bacillus infantis TaxID=324767 RepID=A0A5D4RJJ4_9BACI|nr:hypothetical protein [Bacillus infantis]TYS49888.1 hypothetical protein FZD51_04800 [Bacillus infantis]